MSELSGQETMVLRMMEAITLLGQKFDRTRCALCVEEKVVKGVGEVSGGHSASGTNASAVEGNGTGSALVCPRWLRGFKRAGRDLRSRLRRCPILLLSGKFSD